MSRVQRHRCYTSLNVVGVSLKCQACSSSVSFLFTRVDFVDGFSSIDFVFFSVFMHLCGNSFTVQLCGNFGNAAFMWGKKKDNSSMECLLFVWCTCCPLCLLLALQLPPRVDVDACLWLHVG